MSDSDSDSRSRPLRASRRPQPQSEATPKAMYQSGEDITNKYLQKSSATAAIAAAAAASPVKESKQTEAEEEAVASAQPAASVAVPAPTFGMVRPSPSPLLSASINQAALERSELDDTLNNSIDPGSKSQPQPGATSQANSSFFAAEASAQSQRTHAAASPTRHSATPVVTAAPSPDVPLLSSSSQTRYSYADPNNPTRMKSSASDEEEEESAFVKQIKPLQSQLWNQAIEPKQTQPLAPSSTSAAPRPATAAEQRQSEVRVDQYHAVPASFGASAAGAADSSNGMTQDQSRVYSQLMQRWEQDQQEIQQLREEKAAAQQQQQPPFADSPNPANPLIFFSASSRGAPPPLPPALRASQFELDALGALQLIHSDAEKASLAATNNLLQDSFYTGDVKLDEVLVDHKRLRQRLRAAQHAIEALASHSETEGVDASLGHSMRGGGSVTNPLSPRMRRSGYAPAISSPTALSLSQYAHLPPARAVLKLLNRLEREEEAYLADRASWKKEKASLLHQLQTLYTDLKHLTALSHQAQVSETYHRQRECEQEEVLARVRADREAERVRWAEIEKSLKDSNMQERVRFNQEVSKLERNDAHYKEKYDAVLAVLKRYEAERRLPSHQQADQALLQQKKLFEVLAKEFEQERTSMLATLAKQEVKFKELQQQVQLAERQKDALIHEQRAELEREMQRRINSEQQLLAMQQSVTRTIDDKLQQINSFVDKDRQSSSERQPTVQHAAAQIANDYAHVQREEPLYESLSRRSLSRSRSRRPDFPPDRALPVYSNEDSGRSESPPVRRSPAARGAARAPASSFPLRLVDAGTEHILSLLPPNSNVRGDIEFVLPADYDDNEGAEDEDAAYDRSGRPRYARPTYSSHQAASIAQQLYYPPQPRAAHSRSRSRSVSRRERRIDPERALDAGSRVRQEVDRRVQFESQMASAEADEDAYYQPRTSRRSRSHSSRDRDAVAADPTTRVGPSVNGHSGVTVRVVKKQPAAAASSRVSAATRTMASKNMARQMYRDATAYDREEFDYDRYGRVSEARGV